MEPIQSVTFPSGSPYMKHPICALLMMIGISFTAQAIEPIKVELNEPLKEYQMSLTSEMEENRRLMIEAQAAGDDQLVDFLSDLHELLDSDEKCLALDDDTKTLSCMYENELKMAEKGNPLAQHALANTLLREGDTAGALKWYELAMKNTKTIKEYLPAIENDLKKAKGEF